MSTAALPRIWTVRPATAADNEALCALTVASPMRAGSAMVHRRDPDFFALPSLEAGEWRVTVAEDDRGALVGSQLSAVRPTFLGGDPGRAGYVGDLRVHPDHRGTGVADALAREACEWFRDRDPDLPVVGVHLAGNKAMAARFRRSRAFPRFTPVGTIGIWTLPCIASELRVPGIEVRPAQCGDVDAMVECHRRHHPDRWFAPVIGPDGLLPLGGPQLADHLIAIERATGRVVGWVALWDQAPVRRTVVTRWGWGARCFHAAWSLVGPWAGLPALPPRKAPLRQAHLYRLCVPLRRAEVLRALILAARALARARGIPLLTVACDRRDPAAAGSSGLLAFQTDLAMLVGTPRGGTGAWSDDPAGPFHFEPALL